MAQYRDDGIFLRSGQSFCCVKTTITVRQSNSLQDREIGKQFVPLWRVLAEQLKLSSLMEMTKVPLLSQRSTPAHKSSASRIEETALENLCSNLPLLEAHSCLHLLHLTCVFLVFLMVCCNGSARPMCDGRPFASPLFRRLAGRGALSRGFPFQWVLHFALSMTRCLTVHDATSCTMDMNVGAHAIPCRASSLLPYGFSGANLHWYRRFGQPRI